MEQGRFRSRVIATLAEQSWLSGARILSLTPALALGAYWLAGESALVTIALFVPVLAISAGTLLGISSSHGGRSKARADRMDVSEAEERCSDILEDARRTGLATAALAIDLGGLEDVATEYGEHEAECLRATALQRMRSDLRPSDMAVRIGDRRFLVILEPTKRLDLERLTELANRLQARLEEPVSGEQQSHCLTAAIGLCAGWSMPADAGGEDLLDAALMALAEAAENGASAIRPWSRAMDASRHLRRALRSDIVSALECGQIQPWFQPQICTSTGKISGVEALARWTHPDRGVIPPADFIEAIEAGGLLSRLGEVIIRGSLSALNDWSAQGLDVPRVSVNLSGFELREPTLPDRIAWELDRQDISGDRLCIEVLETAFCEATGPAVSANVTRLKSLGCSIDLDDFGTGNASIMALHRLPIDRVKIDRSFISGIDRNENQRRMVAGILSLAEQLRIETLAEGVESAGEHALLAQLGCGHVQGFRIARPMPAEQLADWAAHHAQNIAFPDLTRRAR